LGEPEGHPNSNEVCNIGQPAFLRPPHSYLSSLKIVQVQETAQWDVVIEMEDPRCKIVAIEMDDLRCRSPFDGVVIEIEDLRCKSLLNRVVLEIEDARCSCVAIKMEDPRCQSSQLAW